ncbi:hypothetical protein [Nocardia salmonicida]|uniref:hypothetical protein n=1 Tax=Nocardia salmonicida TaxID=53431 RepID=UPI00378A0BDE
MKLGTAQFTASVTVVLISRETAVPKTAGPGLAQTSPWPDMIAAKLPAPTDPEDHYLMPMLRLLGTGAAAGGFAALYETDNDTFIAQGLAARDGAAVLVPTALLDKVEPGMPLLAETTTTEGVVLIAGTPVDEQTRDKLLLEPDETAVEVPRTGR